MTVYAIKIDDKAGPRLMRVTKEEGETKDGVKVLEESFHDVDEDVEERLISRSEDIKRRFKQAFVAMRNSNTPYKQDIEAIRFEVDAIRPKVS